jgi:hypothetical protein
VASLVDLSRLGLGAVEMSLDGFLGLLHCFEEVASGDCFEQDFRLETHLELASLQWKVLCAGAPLG